jgi:hypothetical protein
MKVIIGGDPDKRSHTATMVDRDDRELRRIKVRAGGCQVSEVLAWADGVKPRTWAIESAGGMGLPAGPATRHRRRVGGQRTRVGLASTRAGAGDAGAAAARDGWAVAGGGAESCRVPELQSAGGGDV